MIMEPRKDHNQEINYSIRLKKDSCLLLLICLLATSSLYAQNFSINLSQRHSKQLNSFKSGHKRLVKYYRFYKKDSARHQRNQERIYRNTLDSACKAQVKQNKLSKQLAKKGISLPSQYAEGDTLTSQLNKWYAVLKDSTASDGAKQLAAGKVKELALEKARQYPGFQHILEKYQLSGDTANWKTVTNQVPGLDTLSGLFNSSPEKLFTMAEEQANKRAQSLMGNTLGGSFAEAEKLKDLPGQYKTQYEKYTNPDQLKAQGKEAAVKEAADYFAKNAGKLQGAQQKVSKLLSKYREFSNSNDLSTAVKRTSMEGKTFWEHLLIGGNFNVVSTQPFSLDLSPQLGYKIRTNLAVGVGMNYRYTYSDSIKNGYYVSPTNTSFKAFGNYDIIKSFFLYTEFERSGIKSATNDKTAKTWKNNYFVGVGRKFLVVPKVYVTITALYNLNNESYNPVHPHRFQIRTGFQLSELATKKKKFIYDPNR